MKISVFNAHKSILDDPWKGKPFSLTQDRWVYTDDLDEADYILGYTDFLNCSPDFKKIVASEQYKKHTNKFVFVSMHDNTSFLYRRDGSIKLNCQPMNLDSNCNMYTIPLHMRNFEHFIQGDKGLIEECRNTPKSIDAIFVGQMDYADRQGLKIYKNDPRVEIFESASIFDITSFDDRINIMTKFCRVMARAKFAFCPRGVGSSSFRLYQSMMVGTVPVEYGAVELPFNEVIDWNNTIYRINNTNEYNHELISKLNQLPYNKMRDNCIKYWDRYLSMEATDRYIVDNILK